VACCGLSWPRSASAVLLLRRTATRRLIKRDVRSRTATGMKMGQNAGWARAAGRTRDDAVRAEARRSSVILADAHLLRPGRPGGLAGELAHATGRARDEDGPPRSEQARISSARTKMNHATAAPSTSCAADECATARRNHCRISASIVPVSVTMRTTGRGPSSTRWGERSCSHV
jgi:hypothetical protein